MFSWPVLMLMHNLFASIIALQSRRLAKQYKGADFQIMGGVFVVMYVAFLGYAAFNWHAVSFEAALPYLPQLVLTGATFAASAVATFAVFKFVDAAVGSLFATLNLVAIVAVSSLTIHETLTTSQLVGASLLFGAIIIVLMSHVSRNKLKSWEIGLALSLLASVLIGAAVASEKYLLDHIGAPTYSVLGVGMHVTFSTLAAFVFGRKHLALFKKPEFVKEVTAMGAVRGLAGLTFVISLVYADNASLIGALSGLKIIIIALLAAVFLGERQFIKRKLAAASVAMVGIWIMMSY